VDDLAEVTKARTPHTKVSVLSKNLRKSLLRRLVGGFLRTKDRTRTEPMISMDRILAAIEERDTSLSNPGFCLACGEDADGCEPDARNYECECCGEKQVFGAEELLFM
jgi:hypothetical protein